MSISKSLYTLLCKCEKAFWLNVFDQNKATPIDHNAQARIDEGIKVGILARQLFGGGVDMTTKNGDNLDIAAMITKTQEAMRAGISPIYEAAFSNDGNYCAVDILVKTQGGWAIYEVKSTSFPEFKGSPSKLNKYAPDIAYQKWLLEQCGVNVTGVYLVCLNSNYKREGDLDLNKLFHIEKFDEFIADEYAKVPERISKAKDLLKQTTEPSKDLGDYCFNPYPCAFWQYCKQQKGLPEPSVFDVYGGKNTRSGIDRFFLDKKLENYYAGRVSFDQLKSQPLGRIQKLQVEGKEHIDKAGIRSFLDTLSYPLYFLDFETMMYAVPEYDQTKPYQQVTFQYSLHIQENASAPYIHREYLAPSDGCNPMPVLAEKLCKDIPKNVCVLAYNKSFECSRINEMAEIKDIDPALKNHLLNIRENIKDLLDPFQAGFYYLPAMNGSFSIKSVLPALFPDDPDLNYHNLAGLVHNGTEAMTIFPKIKDMAPADATAARQSLLEYCKLDTWAMVKVLEALKEIVK